MSAIIRAHENSWRSKSDWFEVSDELEHAFTHAHSVKWPCDRSAAEYLELPIHGGNKNNSPPSYADTGIGSALAELSAFRTTMSG